MTPEEKAALATSFRDNVALINSQSDLMAANNIKCVTTITSQGSVFDLEFGDTPYPSTINVTQIVGCEVL